MGVEQVERRALADRQIVATFRAAGAETEIPDMESFRAAFDEALVAEPETESPSARLRRELGVA